MFMQWFIKLLQYLLIAEHAVESWSTYRWSGTEFMSVYDWLHSLYY